jgi:hypothetical protein
MAEKKRRLPTGASQPIRPIRARRDAHRHAECPKPWPKLVQARAAECLQVMLQLGALHDRHLVCDPGERNIGLRTA